MFQANLPKIFWSYAVTHSVYIINRIPTPTLGNKCLYQLLYNCLPDLTQHKVFGSLCFSSTLASHRSKFDPRATRCVFLGYKSGTKGYIVYDLKTKELSVSQKVIFHENIFPYQLKSSTHTASNSNIPLLTFIPMEPFDYTPPQSELEAETRQNPLPNNHTTDAVVTPHNLILVRQCSTTRIRKPSSYLQDYHCNLAAATATPHQSSGKGNLYPLSQVLSYDRLTLSYQSFFMNITTTPKPTRYSEVVKHEFGR